jgi:hypothetical protein
MPLDPAKIDTLVGQLTQAIERLEHLEMKLRAAGGGSGPGDAGSTQTGTVAPTQRGVADRRRKDAAGGYAPIEPHQAGFVPEARADAARRKR